MPIKKSKAILTAALALCAAAILFAAGVGVYAGVQGYHLRGTARRLQSSAAAEGSRRAQETSWSDWKNIEGEYARFCKATMTPEAEIAKFRSDLTRLIQDNRLTVATIPYSPKVIPVPRVKCYRINLNLLGEYPNLKKFIHDIESYPQMLFIIGVQLNLDKAGVVGNIELEVYLGE